MTTQPNPDASGAWSWAVQRELDSLKQETNTRLADMATRASSAVTNVEYIADKRFVELQLNNLKDSINDVEKDITTLKTDMTKVVDEQKRDNTIEHQRLDKAIQDEAVARVQQQKEDAKARQSQFRWIISAVLVPVVLAVMELLLNKK